MLRARDLKFSYSDSVKFEFPDIQCGANETCLILGKSGVGKTTLLHLLGGLIEPSQGIIEIDQQNLESLKGKEIDAFRGKNIGIVFQKAHFIASLNILQNLLLTQKLGNRSTDKGEILNLLDQLGIKHRAYSKPSQLSQGEIQRASVARAVLNKPKVILADEPTSALDDESCEQVVNLLQATSKSLEAALLIVTHDGRLKNIIDHQILLT